MFLHFLPCMILNLVSHVNYVNLLNVYLMEPVGVVSTFLEYNQQSAHIHISNYMLKMVFFNFLFD